MQSSQKKHIEITNVSKIFTPADGPVLNDVNCTIPKGMITALVGSSGSGKTTLLRIIAGFEQTTHGTIHIDEKLVASPTYSIPSAMRNIGMVFQDFALFPHLTVHKNILFGIDSIPRAAQKKRLQELLHMSNLGNVEHNFPHELSGGQKQRVAIARALAQKKHILILDEPFNSIDLHLKDSMLESLRNMLLEENITTIFVTHDRDEAFRIADHIILLNNGHIIQQGSPKSIYSKPQSMFTANFFGKTNKVSARPNGDHVITPLGPIALNKIYTYRNDAHIEALMIRPSMLLIEEHTDDEFCTCCQGTLIQKRFYGSYQEVQFTAQKTLITCTCPPQQVLKEQKSYCLSLHPDAQPAALYAQ